MKDKPWKVYIAGPMTGIPEYNYPAFRAAAERLRAAGYEVVDPSTLHDEPDGSQGGKPYHEYLRTDIAALVQCNAIALLDGWENSKGAQCEAHIAETLGMIEISPYECVQALGVG